MRQLRRRRLTVILVAAIMTLAVMSPQIGAIAGIPDVLVMRTGSEASLAVSLPLSAELAQNQENVIERFEREFAQSGASVNLTAGAESGTAEVIFRLLGLVPVKTVTVSVEPSRVLIPGGRSLGVAVQTQGVVVVGSSDLGKNASPARVAGLRAGDVIYSVNGEPVNGSKQLSEHVADGSEAKLGVIRENERLEVEVTPVQDTRDGMYRLGVWVRDSTAGVGTLTFYDPQKRVYGALGHAITDVDTGILFPLANGAVYDNTIVQITRGAAGEPGELTGEFFSEDVVLGEIENNTEFGIFGTSEEMLCNNALYSEGLPVGTRSEIHTGPAQILTSLDGQTVKAYDCEIEKLFHQNQPETRSMVVHVTDPALLEETGGIVQGMSGSPVIQDGKIVGAVTHVFVSDPTRGYGIYIEWMLDAADG